MITSQVILQTATTDLTPLLQTLGVPAVEGGLSGVVGYVLGKVLKTVVKIIFYIVAFFVGAEVALAAWLESIGAVTITINYDKLTELSATATTWATSQLSVLTTAISSLTVVGVGFGAGFVLGLTR